METASQEKNVPVRARFAPSPTGHLHLGGARTALYNWLFARGAGGAFILRIEDTDVKRSEQSFTQQIIEDMRWLGLDWDEGPEKGGPYAPYFQSERMESYRQYCQRLLFDGKAYHCFCPAEELEARRREAERTKAVYGYDGRCRGLSPQEVDRRLAAGDPAAVRLRVPEGGHTAFKDLIRKTVSVSNAELDDFIIVRSDGMPTYNFTVVVDDLEMNITHVIRGDDHISNTPKQILLYQGLGKVPPLYAHIPMILGPDGQRLSKRHGATAIHAYREMGYLPEAMVNYLALLGWAFDDKQTIFSVKDLIEKFSLKGVSKRAAIFDNQKLLWMNGVYLRDMDADRLLHLCKHILKERFSECCSQDEHVRKVLSLVQARMKTLQDAVDLTSYFWEDEITYTPEAREKLLENPQVSSLLQSLQERLTVLKSFSMEELERSCGELIAQFGIGFGVLAHPLRAAVTGRTASPGIFEILVLLGKERVLDRIADAISFIEKEKGS